MKIKERMYLGGIRGIGTWGVGRDVWKCSGEEEIDVVSVTNDVLPLSDDDSDEEVDDVGDLRVDNFIQDSEHEYS
nr:hypothetical protein [Tanacetum cinerariifolium]